MSAIGLAVTCTGSFQLTIDADSAIALFTPEGERAWVEGWDPRYPVEGVDDSAPGTVFVTPRPDGEVVWVVTAAAELSRSYARFDPRGIAATIEVSCEALGEASARVTVTYMQTALDPRHAGELEEFGRGYDDYLAAWREAIEAAIERGDAG